MNVRIDLVRSVAISFRRYRSVAHRDHKIAEVVNDRSELRNAGPVALGSNWYVDQIVEWLSVSAVI
jgi:hypothetical protein